ncbi:hypothetical protein AAVH_36384 [Aphelenchoides avenae]|nr:hypothetical protein AAVH_36384 [Aphelenchus avenae]
MPVDYNLSNWNKENGRARFAGTHEIKGSSVELQLPSQLSTTERVLSGEIRQNGESIRSTHSEHAKQICERSNGRQLSSLRQPFVTYASRGIARKRKFAESLESRVDACAHPTSHVRRFLVAIN